MDIKDTAEIFQDCGKLVIAAKHSIGESELAKLIGGAVLKNPKIKVKHEAENKVLGISPIHTYTISVKDNEEE